MKKEPGRADFECFRISGAQRAEKFVASSIYYDARVKKS